MHSQSDDTGNEAPQYGSDITGNKAPQSGSDDTGNKGPHSSDNSGNEALTVVKT